MYTSCDSVITLRLHHTRQVTLSGHEGLQAEYMGVYSLSKDQANGAEMYVKPSKDGQKHFLFRSSDSGKWVATFDGINISENLGSIVSSEAADLPSSAGLTWQYDDGDDWRDDPNMRCTAVRTPPQRLPQARREGRPRR